MSVTFSSNFSLESLALSDEKLEEKLPDIFSYLSIEVEGADIEDCVRLSYANPKNTTVRFAKRKFDLSCTS